MRATLRLFSLYFTVFPTVLRLVQAAGALLAVDAIVVYSGGAAVEHNGAPVFVAFLFSAILLLIPLLFTMGAVFRILSSPKAYRFFPAFRARLLAATGIVLCLATATTAALVSSAEDMPLLTITIYAAGVWSVMLWVPFFAPRSIPVFVLAVLAIGLGGRLVEHWSGSVDHNTLAPILGVGLLGAWAAFIAWYLNAKRIEPFTALRLGMLTRSARTWGVRLGNVSLRDASAAYLWGSPPNRINRALGLLSLAVAWALLTALMSTAESGKHVPFGLLFAYACMAFPVGRGVASRARLLWLRSPADRAGLFRTIERTLLRREPAQVAILIMVVVCMAAPFTDVSFQAAVALLASTVATSVAGTYLGLMCLRGLGTVEWAVVGAYGLGAMIASAGATLQPVREDLLLVVAGAQALCAVLCRSAALRRWRDVDWLSFRPVRIGRAV